MSTGPLGLHEPGEGWQQSSSPIIVPAEQESDRHGQASVNSLETTPPLGTSGVRAAGCEAGLGGHGGSAGTQMVRGAAAQGEMVWSAWNQVWCHTGLLLRGEQVWQGSGSQLKDSRRPKIARCCEVTLSFPGRPHLSPRRPHCQYPPPKAGARNYPQGAKGPPSFSVVRAVLERT